jgi:CBS domain-containing protein
MPSVKDILEKKGRDVATTTPTVTVLEATRLMNTRHVGALLVVEGGSVVGIFTERDVLTRVVAAGREPGSTKVEDVMSTPVAYCTLDTPLDDCRAIFTDKHIRHLAVMNGDQLAGIITSGDILAFEVTSHEQTIRYLQEYIHG